MGHLSAKETNISSKTELQTFERDSMSVLCLHCNVIHKVPKIS